MGIVLSCYERVREWELSRDVTKVWEKGNCPVMLRGSERKGIVLWRHEGVREWEYCPVTSRKCERMGIVLWRRDGDFVLHMRNTISGLVLGDVNVFKMSTYVCKPNLETIYLNPRLRYDYLRFRTLTSAILDLYFRFRFRSITGIGMLFSSSLPNCIEIGPPASTLIVPPTRLTTVGDRAFPVVAARVWNGLSPDVTSAPSLPSFKRRLKTELFTRSYPDSSGRVWFSI